MARFGSSHIVWALSEVRQTIRRKIRTNIYYTLIPWATFVIWIVYATRANSPLFTQTAVSENGVVDSFSSPSLGEVSEQKSWLQQLHLQNITYFMMGLTFITLAGWLIGATYFHLRYYSKQKLMDESGKLLPNKTTPTWSELMACAGCIVFSALLTAPFMCYISNRGPLSKVYFNLTEYPLWWLLLQFPVVVLYQVVDHAFPIFVGEEFIVYWFHRLFHTPAYFMAFHKMHHRIKTQTAWNFLIVHPAEISIFAVNIFIIPAFVVPLHYVPLAIMFPISATLDYMQHVGVRVDFPPALSWLASSGYHILHHKNPTKNLGFQIRLFDKLHGTFMDDNVELMK